ncbi:hypothetical protein OF83DRAFT_1072937 [Amylostereum chailletii]|nr:hypothetical protein OF83DRAFT_1072937 [Amylostereum chailletii]
MRWSEIVRTSEGVLSTVHRGTAFEKRSLGLLRAELSMSLTRVGGRSDGGIDLVGWWWVPEVKGVAGEAAGGKEREGRRRVRVVAQCKAEKKKLGPGYLRELEGVVYKQVASGVGGTQTESAGSGRLEAAEASPVVALLISQSSFTRGCLLAAQASPVPLLLLHLPEAAEREEGRIGSGVWNAALGSGWGVSGGEMELRWERAEGELGRPGLWWKGSRLSSWVPESESECSTGAV